MTDPILDLLSVGTLSVALEAVSEADNVCPKNIIMSFENW